MSIKCKAILSNLSVGQTPYYRLVPQDVKKITEAEFLSRLATKAGQDVVQARYWLDTFRDVLYAYLADNKAVDLNFLYGKLYVGGSLNSVTEQPNRVSNPVKPRIYAKGELASAIASLDVVNDTLTVPALINEVMQDDASDKNRIEAANKRVVITGNCLKQDSTQTDNGVWLENAETGIVVATGTVSYSDASTIYVTFSTLPTTGRYKLVVTSRNGLNAETYALAKVTRLVYVVNG